MTASAIAQIPLAAGSALAAGVGRTGLWALAQYMRAPFANTGLAFLVGFSALAGSNALYSQTARHPAPLFMPAPGVPQPVAGTPEIAAIPAPPVSNAPAASAPPTPAAPRVTSETTGSLNAVVPGEPVGNPQVFEVQVKLLELELFTGTVDGYYGPMTAAAIRAFEERNGMTPLGALTPAVVEAILKSDRAGRVQAAPSAAIAPVPAPAPPAEMQAAAPDRLVGPAPPEPVIDTVVAAATETIGSIVAAVENGRSTTPVPTPNAPVPVASIPAAPPAQAPAQQMPPPVPVAAVPAATPPVPAADETLVTKVQRGLASLGFLHGAIDGRPGDATARAIRNFEVYHNYRVSGEIKPELVDMLRAAGASI